MKVTNEIFIEGNLIEKSKVKVCYKGRFTREFSNEVYIVFGYGLGWKNIKEQKMTWIQDGFYADIELVSEGTLNFCFKNDFGVWDNNFGNDYSVIIKPEEKIEIPENKEEVINAIEIVQEVSPSYVIPTVEETMPEIPKVEVKEETPVIPESTYEPTIKYSEVKEVVEEVLKEDIKEESKEEVKQEEKKVYEPKHVLKKEKVKKEFTKKDKKDKKRKKDRYNKKFEDNKKATPVFIEKEESLFEYINNSQSNDYTVDFAKLLEEERASREVPKEQPTRRERRAKKQKRRKTRRGLRIFFLFVLIALIAYVVINFMQAKGVEKETESLWEKVTEKVTETIKVNERVEKVKKLTKEHPDMKAWIEIPETSISYPVMQGTDNDYYVKHDYKGEKSKWGALFVDKAFDWEKPSSNILIYGHNFSDGIMFADLLKYKDKEFYDEHKTIHFTTIDEDAEYEIIAAFNSRVYYTHEENVFRYYFFVDAKTEEEYNDYVKNAKKASLYEIEATAEYGDQLLTLSTCDYIQEDGRFVVVARKVVNEEN